MKKDNLWKTIATGLSSRIHGSNSAKTTLLPTGRPGTYTLVEANPFVAIERGKVLMVSQHRYTLQRMVMELPAGGIDPGEEPLAAAKRELKEETGYEADNWEYLGDFYEVSSVCRQQGHLFIAQNLHTSSDNQMIEGGIERYQIIALDEIEKMITTGELKDNLTPAALYRVKLKLAANPKTLIQPTEL